MRLACCTVPVRLQGCASRSKMSADGRGGQSAVQSSWQRLFGSSVSRTTRSQERLFDTWTRCCSAAGSTLGRGERPSSSGAVDVRHVRRGGGSHARQIRPRTPPHTPLPYWCRACPSSSQWFIRSPPPCWQLRQPRLLLPPAWLRNDLLHGWTTPTRAR